jgi:hypothetical protein
MGVAATGAQQGGKGQYLQASHIIVLRLAGFSVSVKQFG